jgi:hypothetical protein
VAKGHDFRRVTLVAALNPDGALFSADFRAPERLFSLLMQAAGRAGRDAELSAGSPCEMWVQTFHPAHPLFETLKQHDFEKFAEQQLQERSQAGLPPFTFQALVRAEARSQDAAQAFLNAAREAGDTWLGELELAVTIYPAVPMSMQRVANVERAQMLLTTLATLRDLLADGALEQRGLIIDEVVNEVFGKLGYSDGSRFFDMEGKDLRIKALEQQIAQLQQALDAKIPPQLLDAQIRKIEAEIAAMGPKAEGERAKAIKTHVEATYNALQGAQVLAAVPGVAPIADEIMVSGGADDPNYVAPPAPLPGMTTMPLFNRRTGIETQQAGAQPPPTSR